MDEEFEITNHPTMQHTLAMLKVAYLARALWETTDENPLCNLNSEQSGIWDELCNAMVVANEWIEE